MFVVTTRLPVVAPSGTVVAIVVDVELVTFADTPLNVTEFELAGEVKLVPVIVTGVPAGPEGGDAPVIVGEGTIVNGEPLLAGSPGIVTTTFPVVAPLGTMIQMRFGLQL